MQNNNFRKIFKKGHQLNKILLGFLKKTIEMASDLISNSKKYAKNFGLLILGSLCWPPIIIKKFAKYLWKFGKNLWINIKVYFYNTLGILVALFSVFLTVFFVFLLIKHINPSFISSLSFHYIITPDSYNSETIKSLTEFIAQGKIINASEIYNHMLEYYNALITILIALLGVFGFISWISIQSKIKHETETSVDNKFENKDFQCRLEKEVEKIAIVVAKGVANKILNDEEYISKIADENIDKIFNKIMQSTEFINIMKEITQNAEENENMKLQPLNGVENGDEVQ